MKIVALNVNRPSSRRMSNLFRDSEPPGHISIREDDVKGARANFATRAYKFVRSSSFLHTVLYLCNMLFCIEKWRCVCTDCGANVAASNTVLLCPFVWRRDKVQCRDVWWNYCVAFVKYLKHELIGCEINPSDRHRVFQAFSSSFSVT